VIRAQWIITVLLAIAPNLVVLTLFFMLYLIWGRIMSVVNFSYRMALTPDEMRGRSSGIGNLLVRGSLPIGIALTGTLIQNLGVVMTVFIITGCRALIALAATLNSHVRNAPQAVKAQLE